MVRKIGLEEHCLSPGLVEYWMPTVAQIDPSIATRFYSRLNDFGEQRLNAMEAAGIRVSPSPARLGKTLVDVLKS